MEIPKIKKGIYAHLPEVMNTVKLTSIAREMGVTQVWLSIRLNRLLCKTRNTYYTRRFRPADVEPVNQGIWRLGEKLLQVQLPYNPDRTAMAIAVKQALGDLFAIKFVATRLGLTECQARMRMLSSPNSTGRPSFTPEEVESLVMGVREVGLQLLSTEFYLDEE